MATNPYLTNWQTGPQYPTLDIIGGQQTGVPVDSQQGMQNYLAGGGAGGYQPPSITGGGQPGYGGTPGTGILQGGYGTQTLGTTTPGTSNVQGSYNAPQGSIVGSSGNTYGGNRGTTLYNAGQAGTQFAGTHQAGLSQAGYQTYDPFKRTVDAPTETVQGQLASILDADSSYIQRSRAKAAEVASARGILNSSIAAGAGEAAAIDAALPIAQQDAQTYTVAAQNNQQAINSAREFGANAYNQNQQFNTGEANKVGMFNAGEANTTERFNTGEINTTNRFNVGEQNKGLQFSAEAGNQVNLADINNAAAMERTVYSENAATSRTAMQIASNQSIANAEREQRERLTHMEANNRALIQGNATAGQIWSTGQGNIGAIQRDPNMTDEGKRNAINQEISNMQTGMAVAGRVAGMDFGDTIDWSSAYVAAPPPPPPPAAAAPAQQPGGTYGGPAGYGLPSTFWAGGA